MTVQPLVQPIPTTIISGFLGSGKTTLLNNILHGQHGLKIAVLVNDFGEVNIDSQLIVGVEGETVSLSNGCICCSIRGDLVNAIVKLVNRDDRPDYIVIETSGVSDPVAVAMTFRMPELMYFVQLEGIITLVDAENFLMLEGEDKALGITQLEMADIVVLNKVDIVTTDYLEQVKSAIVGISRNARILETTYGNAPLEFIMGVGNFSPERLHNRPAMEVHVHGVGEQHDHNHDHEHDHTLVYSTWNWRSEQPISLDKFREFVNSIPKTVYRSKGVLYLQDIPQHMAVFHLVGKRASLVLAGEWESTVPHSQIVFIGSHGGVHPEALQAGLEASLG
jgi:G3E family GTPase